MSPLERQSNSQSRIPPVLSKKTNLMTNWPQLFYDILHGIIYECSLRSYRQLIFLPLLEILMFAPGMPRLPVLIFLGALISKFGSSSTSSDRLRFLAGGGDDELKENPFPFPFKPDPCSSRSSSSRSSTTSSGLVLESLWWTFSWSWCR